MTSARLRRRLAWAIFAAGMAVRLTLLYGLRDYEIGRYEAARIAISLARTGAFADPYALPTGPTAHTAPLYPAMSAPFYGALGVTPEADVARFAWNGAAASAAYALLPAVAEALGIGWWTGAVAGLFGALVPLHYWPECVNDFENSWTALFLVAAVWWFARLLRPPSKPVAHAIRGGILWGAGLLLAPAVAPVLAAFLAILWRKRRLRWRWTAALVLTVAAALAPWTVRNWVRLGGPIFVRDDAGLELFVSNRDGAGAIAERNPSGTSAHPFTDAAAAREVQRMGELPFERRCMRQALAWIGAHPREFSRLTAERALLFWFPAAPRFRWALWAITALAAIGFIRMWRARRAAAIVLAALLLSYSAFFYFIQHTLRYQHPVWWALLLLAVWAFPTLRYTKPLRFTPECD